MKGTQKIKAGALQFVLFVGAIIAVLLLMFVLVAYSHTLFLKKTDLLVDMIQGADRGLQASFEKRIPSGGTVLLPLDTDKNITTQVEKTHWGLLELRKVMTTKGKLYFEKLALVGHSGSERPALYLQDNLRPLILAGNTQILGTVYLPERGVRTGNISGYSYNAPKLIYGQENIAKKTLPVLNEESNRQLEKLTAPFFEPEGEDIPLTRELVLKNSFKEPLKLIKGSRIHLEKVQLSGHIMVWASQKIVVNASSQLEDVVLIAPVIEIGDRVNGSFQAIASESLDVGKACGLDYPTVLSVGHQHQDVPDQNDFVPKLSVDSRCDIRGIIIFEGPEMEFGRFRPGISIKESTSVTGTIFCSESLELKGKVYGSVATGAFIAFENGSIYQNHLYNGTINSKGLPLEFAGIGYEHEVNNQIMKWLY